MENSRAIVLRLGLPSVIGGAVGAALLIATPSITFAKLVPYLILFATVIFAMQEPIRRRFRLRTKPAEPDARWWTIAIVFTFFSAIYGGYFGAGNGILILAALSLLGISNIHQANGVKAIIGILLNGTAIIGFIVAGMIVWPTALIMAVGSILGGYTAAYSARRLPRVYAERAVLVIGVGIGAVMLWRVYS
jgi:hypothetical protein